MTTQKVVIPRGLIKPGETVVVEIPAQLKGVSTVVARPKSGASTPPRRPPKHPARTWPRRNVGGGLANLYDDDPYTFGGRPNETDSTIEEPCTPPRRRPLNLSQTPPQTFPEKSKKPWRTGQAYSFAGAENKRMRFRTKERHSSPGESSSFFAGNVTYPKNWRERGSGIFVPNVIRASSLREIDDPRETSLYCDFRPTRGMSPRAGSPGQSPDTLRHWHSSIQTISPPMGENVSSGEDYSYEEAPYYCGSPVCPRGNPTYPPGYDERGNQSYSSPEDSMRGNPMYPPGYDERGNRLSPSSYEESGSSYEEYEDLRGNPTYPSPYQEYEYKGDSPHPSDEFDSDGGSPQCRAPCASSGSSYESSDDSGPPQSMEEAEALLDQVETGELKDFVANVRNYQTARRKLFLSVARMNTAQDVANVIQSSSDESY